MRVVGLHHVSVEKGAARVTLVSGPSDVCDPDLFESLNSLNDRKHHGFFYRNGLGPAEATSKIIRNPCMAFKAP